MESRSITTDHLLGPFIGLDLGSHMERIALMHLMHLGTAVGRCYHQGCQQLAQRSIRLPLPLPGALGPPSLKEVKRPVRKAE